MNFEKANDVQFAFVCDAGTYYCRDQMDELSDFEFGTGTYYYRINQDFVEQMEASAERSRLGQRNSAAIGAVTKREVVRWRVAAISRVMPCTCLARKIAAYRSSPAVQCSVRNDGSRTS